MLPRAHGRAARAVLRALASGRSEGRAARRAAARQRRPAVASGVAAGGEGVMPALHLPTYFELREIGTNFRYRSDPEWVLDIIQRDCVREEGLTFISAASTYSVTFFQLINYCARRGYQVVSFGMVGDAGRSSGRRYAVLYNSQINALTQAAAPPPELAAAPAPGMLPPAGGPPAPEGGPGGEGGAAELDAGLRSGKYIRWGRQVVPSERRMRDEDFQFYDIYTPGGVGKFDGDRRGPPQPEPAAEAEVVVAGEAPSSGEAGAAGERAAAAAELARDALRGPDGGGRIDPASRYMGEDLRLRISPEEQRTRGL